MSETLNLLSFGGARRDRTDDLMLAKHALSQLSYGPREMIVRYRKASMVGLGGLEPPTSRLSSARSNQLSYKPKQQETDQRSNPQNGGQALCPTERETKTAGPAYAPLTGALIFRGP